MDILKRFILYFRDKAETLIKGAEEHKIINPTARAQQETITSVLNYQMPPLADSALNQINVNKFYLTGEFHGRWLTRQECRCIAWLIRGRTLKEIG